MRFFDLKTAVRYRPSDLAERMRNWDEPGDGFIRETLRLPVEAARAKAREIISECPQGDYMTVVERWRQLPDGHIEFTMRRLRAAD
jgi:hypothetical protein